MPPFLELLSLRITWVLQLLSLGCREWHHFVTDARQALQNRYRIVTVWTSFPHIPEAYFFQNRPHEKPHQDLIDVYLLRWLDEKRLLAC